MPVLKINNANNSFDNINKCELDNLKVLYVEDNHIARLAFEFFLKSLDFDVDIAITACEALQKYFANRYDLILLDAGLPDLSGFEVGKRIRNHEKQTNGQRLPLLLLSAYPSDLIQNECKTAGIDDFLIKPVSFDALKIILTRWLKN